MILCKSLCINSVITYLRPKKDSEDEVEGRSSGLTFLGRSRCVVVAECRVPRAPVGGDRKVSIDHSVGRAYVFVFEKAKHFNLSVDSFAGHKILEDVRHFLEGNPFAIAWIRYGPEWEESL